MAPQSYCSRLYHILTRDHADRGIGGDLPKYSLQVPIILDDDVDVADLLDCEVPAERKAGSFAYFEQRAPRKVKIRSLRRNDNAAGRWLMERGGKPARVPGVQGRGKTHSARERTTTLGR